MAMNRVHQWLCSSGLWARKVEEQFLPWALADTNLGDEVLEIGPGYGATTRVLAKKVKSLSALEIDPALADRLTQRLGNVVRVTHGDGAAMPFASDTFTGVACFTMLHHVSSVGLQDRLFSEAFRVLRPGGMFAGADSMTSFGFRVLHIFDTMVMVDPEVLPKRLEAAGFRDVTVAAVPGLALKFRARKASGPS